MDLNEFELFYTDDDDGIWLAHREHCNRYGTNLGFGATPQEVVDAAKRHMAEHHPTEEE